MPRIYVEFANMKSVANNCKSVSSKIDSIQSNFNRTVSKLDWDMKFEQDIFNKAKMLSKKMDKCAASLKKYHNFLDDAYAEYEKLDEAKFDKNAVDISKVIRTVPGSGTYGDWFGAGVNDDGRGVHAYIGKAGAYWQNDVAYAEANGYLGKAEASYDYGLGFMQREREYDKKTGEWDEELLFFGASASAGASVAALAGDAKAGIGDDMLGAEVAAEGSIGKAEAKAEAGLKVTDEGFKAYAGAEAMASVAEGRAEATVNVLGFDVTGFVEGYAVSAGVKGEIGFNDKGKFVVSGGVAAFLGFGGGFEIGFPW